MKYSLLLCDADNTVFNFTQSERTAFALLCSELGIPFSEDAYAAYHEINDAAWTELERGLLTPATIKTERFVRLKERLGWATDAQTLSDAFLRGLSQPAQLMPGALEAIADIARHMPVALVTNGLRQTQHARFSSSPVMQYITHIYISEDYGLPKPHPGMLLRALEDFGVSASRALMAGDSARSDIAAANAAHIDACMVGDAPCEHARWHAVTIAQLPCIALAV